MGLGRRVMTHLDTIQDTVSTGKGVWSPLRLRSEEEGL